MNVPHGTAANRTGEPATNPYLYFASQIHSGLDGLQRKLPLPPSADTPYEAKADFLPRTLGEAIQCLGGNGYINDYPTGRLWRDAKLYEIGAGTSEIRRMLIGRELFAETM